MDSLIKMRIIIMNDTKKQQQAQLLALYRMILADGKVDLKEISQLYQLGLEEFGLSESEVREAVFTENYALYVPESQVEKAMALFRMAKIAAADNEIDDSERNLLIHYIKAFDFNADNANEIADILLSNAMEGMSIDEFKNTLEL